MTNYWAPATKEEFIAGLEARVYDAKLKNFLLRFGYPLDPAVGVDDLLQSTYLRALKYFRPDHPNFTGFLLTIAQSTRSSAFRRWKRKTAKECPIDELAETQDLWSHDGYREDSTCAGTFSDRLYRALRAAKVVKRGQQLEKGEHPLVLHALGYTTREIAAKAGVNHNTLQSTIWRARRSTIRFLARDYFTQHPSQTPAAAYAALSRECGLRASDEPDDLFTNAITDEHKRRTPPAIPDPI